MISMNVKEKQVKVANVNNKLRNKDLYKKLWKSKYNIVIAKDGENNFNKMLHLIKGKNS